MLQMLITIIPAAQEKLENTDLLVGCSCNNHYYYTSLVQVQQIVQMVGYFYNKYEY